jgi:hypothetical protein
MKSMLEVVDGEKGRTRHELERLPLVILIRSISLVGFNSCISNYFAGWFLTQVLFFTKFKTSFETSEDQNVPSLLAKKLVTCSPIDYAIL